MKAKNRLNKPFEPPLGAETEASSQHRQGQKRATPVPSETASPGPTRAPPPQYRRAEMVRTPWGNSGSLHERKLRPGPGAPRAAVRENQRQRLLAALVACVAGKGYEATTVENLVALSGVSRKAFYEHFADRHDCFSAALEELIADGSSLVRTSYGGDGDWEAGVRGGLESFMALLDSQAAAAQVCFVGCYAAGPTAVERVRRTFEDFAGVVADGLETVPDRAGMPVEIVRAIVGGLPHLIHGRLRRGNGELAGLAAPLWEWVLSYYPPPEPLRSPRRPRDRSPGRDPASFDTTERILRGLAAGAAEKGYPALTVEEIAERGGVSLSTFYSYFDGKEEAMLAALDSGAAQMMATVLPAYRRAPDWPHAVRAAIGACFEFGAREPDYAWLGAVESYAAEAATQAQHDDVVAPQLNLLAPGYELAPDAPPIAGEAVAAALSALVYDQVRAKGGAGLPEIAPLATYVVLCPFLGPEQACEVANGDGRRR